MVACGCSPQGSGCEVGKQLAIDVCCGSALITSEHFPLRPVAQRDAIWQQYQQAVDAYLRHCGYLNETSEAGEKEKLQWR